MTQLQIKTIEWANFMGYGDYHTSLELDSLGPVLILGQRDGKFDESNGCGKSSATIAILWCLFGRTPKRANPGDRIINWHTKKECYVKITTTDGWTITRTRRLNGHDDLIIRKDDIDVSLSTNKNAQQFLKRTFNLDYDIFVSSVFFGQKTESLLGMSDIKRKSTLERLLGLNRLNVFGDIAKEKKTAVEFDQQKHKTIVDSKRNDILRLDGQLLNTFGKSNAFEHDKNKTLSDINLEIEQLELQTKAIVLPDIAIIKNECDDFDDKKKQLVEFKSQLRQAELTLSQLDYEIDQFKSMANRHNNRLTSLSVIDINHLKDQYLKAEINTNKRISLQHQLDRMELKRNEIGCDVEKLYQTIKDWKSKADTICPTCEQNISSKHAVDVCQPIAEKIIVLKKALSDIITSISILNDQISAITIDMPNISIESAIHNNNEIDELNNDLSDVQTRISKKQEQRDKLESITQKFSDQVKNLEATIDVSDAYGRLAKAELIHVEYRTILKQIDDLRIKRQYEHDKTNPYKELELAITNELSILRSDLENNIIKVNDADTMIRQFEYIRRSYHDRNKMKMFLMSGIIPNLNKRIEYYLNAFECDLNLKFTPTLAVETTRWDYDLHSGGQQKRIDLAVMFALYDVYIAMYGKQCNVMVLDEIDGSLDSSGVKSFVDIIQSDFAGDRSDKPDTILIVSHKTEMVDQFSSHVIVTQDSDGFSHILKV